jgi:hypothetical protein
VQQAENAGVGERDSESYGPSHGEGDYKRNQQTPQVQPTFPSGPAATTNGLRCQVFSFPSFAKNAKDGASWSRMLTLPALTLTAVNL